MQKQVCMRRLFDSLLDSLSKNVLLCILCQMFHCSRLTSLEPPTTWKHLENHKSSPQLEPQTAFQEGWGRANNRSGRFFKTLDEISLLGFWSFCLKWNTSCLLKKHPWPSWGLERFPINWSNKKSIQRSAAQRQPKAKILQQSSKLANQSSLAC